ncbi:uncharacterized protein LOC135159832 isoform X2 [Diachasmimorpha longicaudata]|uniref:uncharacterized protein LOC135159832 isoform X2 n=1 Tax=Diachasmimorpha longicaudata TaxID=58733 RepID=UPI0030B91421
MRKQHISVKIIDGWMLLLYSLHGSMTDVMTFYDHEENLEIQSSNAIYGQLMASSWCHSLPHGLTIHDFCMIVNGEVHFIGILLASFVAIDLHGKWSLPDGCIEQCLSSFFKWPSFTETRLYW